MATLYYIQAGATETELPSASGSGLRVNRKVGAVSTASWECCSPCDSAPVWPFGTAVTVLRRTGGTPEILFQGKIVSARGDGTPTSEKIAYTAADAWWDLEREIYCQTRKIANAEGTLSDAIYARALLCQADDGTRLTAAAMCEALTDYAASLGIALQSGTFDAPVTPPWDEIIDKTVAEVILRTLLWQPDAVPWIDHSTVPPTLNVTRRGSMTATAVALTALSQCHVRAYPELQISGCVVTFEFSNARGRTVAEQTAGDPDALGCARMTIPLEHESGQPGPSQEIKTVALGDYTEVAWWQKMFPWLPSDAQLDDFLVTPVQPDGFTNILTAGVITGWMQDELGLDAGSFTVECNVVEMSVDGRTYTKKALSRTFTLTNAHSKNYIGRYEPSWSEAPPAGLAAAFYAAAGALQYGGNIAFSEEECVAGRALLGRVVNVTGGLTAWATMRAAVVAVDEDFDAGTTDVELGPAAHLSPQDMTALIRASRWRSTWSPLSRTDGGVPEQSDTDADPFAPEESASDSPGRLAALLIEHDEGGTVNVDPKSHLDAGQDAHFRELVIPDRGGKTATKFKVLAAGGKAAAEGDTNEGEMQETGDGDGTGTGDDGTGTDGGPSACGEGGFPGANGDGAFSRGDDDWSTNIRGNGGTSPGNNEGGDDFPGKTDACW